MRKHIVREGETLSLIAQRRLGNPAQAYLLRDYNAARLQGRDEVFAGDVLLIPGAADTPSKTGARSDSTEAVVLLAGKRLTGLERVTVQRHIDTVADSFRIEGAYAPDVDLGLKPFGYEQARLEIGGELVVTGIVAALQARVATKGTVFSATVRSRAGELLEVDVTGQREFQGQTLDEIAATLLEPYGLAFSFEGTGEPGPAFTKAVAHFGQSVFEFLSTLAAQRGLLITSTAEGNVAFVRVDPNAAPAADIEEGRGNFLGAQATYNSTLRHSDVAFQGQQRQAKGPLQAVATDRVLLDAAANRPALMRAPQTPEGSDLKTVAAWERGRRLAESTQLTVKLHDWRRPGGGLWRENTMVTAKIPRCFVSKATKFLIRSVHLERTEDGTTTTLSLAPAKAYSLGEA